MGERGQGTLCFGHLQGDRGKDPSRENQVSPGVLANTFRAMIVLQTLCKDLAWVLNAHFTDGGIEAEEMSKLSKVTRLNWGAGQAQVICLSESHVLHGRF